MAAYKAFHGRAFRRRIAALLRSGLIVFTGVVLAACATAYKPSGEARMTPEDTRDFPYNPVVYHLDLSRLAYQMYAQTLVWPYDPYYEDQNNWNWDRAAMMARVRDWTQETGALQTQTGPGLAAYRGPGVLSGFANDESHDPIIYRYAQINPWASAISRSNGRWQESRTPAAITDPIRDVYMCSKPPGGPESAISIDRVKVSAPAPKPDARDVILAFEGETGDKGEPGQAGSQSFLGFALVRHWPGSDKFDVHISFRGSRSGSAGRAFIQALSDRRAKGNPDWITDLGYDMLDAGEVRDSITTQGEVFRGFAQSMHDSSPRIFGCLDHVSTLFPGRAPERVFVTGHSLGGGLAQNFVSSVLMGDTYGPAGAGPDMPPALQNWPWQQIKLVSFAAPRSGDKLWAKTLTETHLQSDFFSTLIDPFDKAALAGNDPAITRRLLRTDIPAGFRVLISRDPVTTGRGIEGKHVGKTVYVNETRAWDVMMPPDVSAHEPLKKRELLLKSLNDADIPTWFSKPGTGIATELPDDLRGSEEAYLKLKTDYEAYYRANNIPFDQARFDRDFMIFMEILRAE